MGKATGVSYMGVPVWENHQTFKTIEYAISADVIDYTTTVFGSMIGSILASTLIEDKEFNPLLKGVLIGVGTATGIAIVNRFGAIPLKENLGAKEKEAFNNRK